jgi:hypothetical protein
VINSIFAVKGQHAENANEFFARNFRGKSQEEKGESLNGHWSKTGQGRSLQKRLRI